MKPMPPITSHWICMVVADAWPSVGVSALFEITWRRSAGTGLQCGFGRGATPGGDPPTSPY
eukprot:5458694-Prorocentrum_lima.AAC.1